MADKDLIIGRVELSNGVESEKVVNTGPYLSADHLLVIKLEARVKELEYGLKRLEFCGNGCDGDDGYCPVCFSEGHEAGCWLGKLLEGK